MAERKRMVRLLTASIIVLLGILFIWFVFPRLLVLVLPFIFAFILSKAIEPIVSFLHKRLYINKKLSSAVMVIVVVGLLIWLISAIVYRVATEVSALVTNAESIAGKVTSIANRFETFLSDRLGDSTMSFFYNNLDISGVGETISDYLTGRIGPLITNIYNAAKSLPNILVFTVVLILGTYFMSSDNDKIKTALGKMVPKAVSAYMPDFKNDMTHALIGYLRAQGILICITFVELLIGFAFIGGTIASYALILAFCISIIDAFPILGTGTVMIPWALYTLISGNYLLAIYLIIIYLVCIFVRQLLEPRIVGKQIGLHPLITLMTMYAGLKAIGVLGMIAGPILALIIKSLSQAGVFRSVGNLIWYGKDDTAD